jgi:hypothetical protein
MPEVSISIEWAWHEGGDTHEEEVRVERLACTCDSAVCEDDLDLEDVVERGSPETRERAEATDCGMSYARQGLSQSVSRPTSAEIQTSDSNLELLITEHQSFSRSVGH